MWMQTLIKKLGKHFQSFRELDKRKGKETNKLKTTQTEKPKKWIV